jgi:hypothetical protein
MRQLVIIFGLIPGLCWAANKAPWPRYHEFENALHAARVGSVLENLQFRRLSHDERQAKLVQARQILEEADNLTELQRVQYRADHAAAAAGAANSERIGRLNQHPKCRQCRILYAGGLSLVMAGMVFYKIYRDFSSVAE